MTKDKIDNNEVDWLISVYKDSNDIELKRESFEKLQKIGLSEEEINKRFEHIEKDNNALKAFNKAWEKQLERNQYEKYTLYEKIKIFFFSPYELFRNFNSGLIELKKENYKIKFKQRLILLLLGIIFWILFITANFTYHDNKRMQEIENMYNSKKEIESIHN